jgi:hypothetical protein
MANLSGTTARRISSAAPAVSRRSSSMRMQLISSRLPVPACGPQLGKTLTMNSYWFPFTSNFLLLPQ